MKTDLVFVILAYRSTRDLREFLQAAAAPGCTWQAVIVNSFYDEATRAEAEAIARQHGCLFLNVENRGYGAGNNTGLTAALAQTDAPFVVIANPDTRIESLPLARLKAHGRAVIGPEVLGRGGRLQNPLHYRRNPLVLLFRRLFALTGLRFFFFVSVFFNKLERAFFRRFGAKGAQRVYALHGSFLVFPREVLKELGGGRLFDERMFLYCEENHVAERARAAGIPMIYDPELRILHREDGSSGDARLKAAHFDITRRSLQVFFKNWRIF